MGDSLIGLLSGGKGEDATNRSHIYNCFENKSVSPMKLDAGWASLWGHLFNFPILHGSFSWKHSNKRCICWVCWHLSICVLSAIGTESRVDFNDTLKICPVNSCWWVHMKFKRFRIMVVVVLLQEFFFKRLNRSLFDGLKLCFSNIEIVYRTLTLYCLIVFHKERYGLKYYSYRSFVQTAFATLHLFFIMLRNRL